MPALAARHASCQRRPARGAVGLCATERLEQRNLLSADPPPALFVAVDGEPPAYQWVAHGALGRLDVDFFRIGRLQAGDVLTVSLSGASSSRGTLPDPIVEVYRAGQNPAAPTHVAFNDDGGTGWDSLLYHFAISTDDEYYLKTRSIERLITGTYDLAAWLERTPGADAPLSGATTSAEAEPNDTAATANDLSAAWRPVTHVSTQLGEVPDEAAAESTAQYELIEGDVVSVAIDSSSTLAAAVSLLDPGGNVVAEDRGGRERTVEDRRDALIFGFHVRASGTFTVRVSGTDHTAGPYRANLHLSRPPPRPPASVVARHVFYNNSAFDGRSRHAGPADDAAIAPDKLALLPGRPATTANITNSSHGINGLMIDVAGLWAEPTVADFTFEASVAGSPEVWASAPAPAAIVRRPGAGTGGSDRITLTWQDGAIIDCWLRVTCRASGSVGLSADDRFLFGNLVGETGDDPAALAVTGADAMRTRARQSGRAGIDDWFDFNRDGRVNALDQAHARAHVGRSLAAPDPQTDPVIVPTRRPLDMRYRRRPPFASGLADSGSSGQECLG